MPALLEQMERSRVWVPGTPVYYQGPTAQFKAFVDPFGLMLGHKVYP